MKKLAVSVGCPSGIGPEVSVVAAAQSRDAVLLVGDVDVIGRALRGRKIAARNVEAVESPRFERGRVLVWQPTKTLAPRDRELGKTLARGRRGAARVDRRGVRSRVVRRGRRARDGAREQGRDRVVGRSLRGRTAVPRAHRAPAASPSRERSGDGLRERRADDRARDDAPADSCGSAGDHGAIGWSATFWLGDFLARTKKHASIAVASLNPHAGERGRIGNEETRIAPGIARAKKRLGKRSVELVGPVPAETAFRLAARGDYDGVVAMYHDQATIPMKLLGFGDAVNVTLGLPIVRTSVDHGTAYDRAARFDADARGMIAAMNLAAQLAQRR